MTILIGDVAFRSSYGRRASWKSYMGLLLLLGVSQLVGWELQLMLAAAHTSGDVRAYVFSLTSRYIGHSADV